MADEKVNNISIGQAIDLVIKNADERLRLLETQYKGLMDSVTAICKKLNYTVEEIKPVSMSDADYLASKTTTENKPAAKVLTPDMLVTEECDEDWKIRIVGQLGTSLVIAKYEYDELLSLITAPAFVVPYEDTKWSVMQFDNGLIKIQKIGKDGHKYFCLI